MKKKIVLFSFWLLLAHNALGSKNIFFDAISAFFSPKKPLTVIVYMAARNDLHSFIFDDLSEMEKVGSTSYLNILVYLNALSPEQEKITRKLVIHKGHTTQYGPDKSKDSGDAQTVIDACKWAIKHYPSDQFVLIFWNHGSGSLNRNPRSVCYDDATGNYLTDYDIKFALKEVTRLLGKKIDIVAFDACLMADLEIAYMLREYAQYIVASQELVPGKGFGYDLIFEYPASHRVNSYELAKIMVHAFEKEYINETQEYTLSALNLSKIDGITMNNNRIAELLTRALETKDSNVALIAAALAECTCFDKKYMDLYHFYQNIQKLLTQFNLSAPDKKNLNELLEEGFDLIKRATVDYVHGNLYPNSHGLSLYFDPIAMDSTYPTTLWAQDTHWIKFLTTYYAMKTNPAVQPA
ncbi:MAG: clostripain-related cysteine peptidase [Candidatus Babeliales bacterium]